MQSIFITPPLLPKYKATPDKFLLKEFHVKEIHKVTCVCVDAE